MRSKKAVGDQKKTAVRDNKENAVGYGKKKVVSDKKKKKQFAMKRKKQSAMRRKPTPKGKTKEEGKRSATTTAGVTTAASRWTVAMSQSCRASSLPIFWMRTIVRLQVSSLSDLYLSKTNNTQSF